ncbi:ligand-binding protein SH3 [Candidatus Peregrinibacteria bacterium]|nr:ligand-binding protein SH3 [Candidatus Peregrinibacteria bacterium]
MKITPELITFFSSMTPFIEMKLAIPLGMEMGLSATSTFLFAVSGTILPAALTLALISPVTEYIRSKSKYLDTFFEKLFQKTRKQHTKKFNRYGALFLILFVAIPLPGSGASAGTIIAFLFGIDYWKGISLISIGTIIAGILLTAGFGSIFALLNLFT